MRKTETKKEKSLITTVNSRIATLRIEHGEGVSKLSLTCSVNGGRMVVVCEQPVCMEQYKQQLSNRFSQYGIDFQTIEINVN